MINYMTIRYIHNQTMKLDRAPLAINRHVCHYIQAIARRVTAPSMLNNSFVINVIDNRNLAYPIFSVKLYFFGHVNSLSFKRQNPMIERVANTCVRDAQHPQSSGFADKYSNRLLSVGDTYL